MKILITGGNGLVGNYLKIVFKDSKWNIFPFGKEILDITNKDNIYKIFKEIKPDIVIHLAAITDVDYCEKNPAIAFNVNSKGTENISIFSEDFKSFLIYISTDFIFDGNKGRPYTEDDIPNPLNVYGKSKLEGENFVRKYCKKYIIIRTSRIFGKNGKNFGSKLPLILKEKKQVYLTTDIVNCPTYAFDLAECIKKLIEKGFYGIINVCNQGWCSWFEFGSKMKEILGLNAELKGISFDELSKIFDIPAKRPKFSPLSLDLLFSINIKIKHWEDSLKDFINEILQGDF